MASRLTLLAICVLGITTSFSHMVRADEYTERRTKGHCYCHRGQASWAYLRSPLAPPEDDPH